MDKNIVIVGGGIHGVSIAFYLAVKYNIASTVIEASSLAAAASGKSGGFLARDWGSGVTRPLHEISFAMHEELARELSLESYRKITTLEVDGNPKRGSKSSRSKKNVASWLNGSNVTSTLMDNNTAQVTSLELVQRMWDVAKDKVGAKFILGRALDIVYANETEEPNPNISRATGLQIQLTADHSPLGHNEDLVTIPAEIIVLAMGPWTSVAVEDWCGYRLPMEGIKSTSIVFHHMSKLGTEEPYACFCAEDDTENCHLEIYPRPNGDVYICGIGGSDHVSGDRLRYPTGDCASANAIQANPTRVHAAYRALSQLSSEFANKAEPQNVKQANILQACMRPCTSDALPVMGLVPQTDNIFLSTGHNCWGILWAPVSGLAMSELIVHGASRTIDLTPFDPKRILQPTSQRLAKQHHQSNNKEGNRNNSQNPLTRGRKQGDHEVGEQW